jgi:hypothetical protein
MDVALCCTVSVTQFPAFTTEYFTAAAELGACHDRTCQSGRVWVNLQPDPLEYGCHAVIVRIVVALRPCR